MITLRISDAAVMASRALFMLSLGFACGCRGFPPKADASLTATISLDPGHPVEVVTVRTRSRTRGERKHQVSVRREEVCQGRPKGTTCEGVPDVLFRIEVPDSQLSSARAFEKGYRCWYGSCDERCFELTSDGERVAGAASTCPEIGNYVTLPCDPPGEVCERLVRFRFLLGDRSARVEFPLVISLVASGEDDPISAELVRE